MLGDASGFGMYDRAMDVAEPSGAMPSEDQAFEAVLYPNQSLGRAGFIALMLAVSSVSVALGLAFALAGAWPIAGFLALDVLLLHLAFRSCRRQAQQREFIRLDATGLYVRRMDAAGGCREWRFEPYWVRVDMDDPPRRDSFLTLASHGLRLRVGAFLTPKERLDLARALRTALQSYR
jgi:uncharacterized membrane protein